MDNQSQLLTRVLSASAIFTAMLVGGFVILDDPFQPARSPAEGAGSLFESRLWEDPLKVVYQIEDLQERAALSPGGDADFGSIHETLIDQREFAQAISAEIGENAIVLGVMMPVGRYSLTSEVRRRIRYAVVSALNQSHIPQSSESLAILSLSRDDLEITSTSGHLWDQTLMSFEVYVPDDLTRDSNASVRNPTKTGKVLVLWIPALALGDEPVSSYARILQNLELSALPSTNPIMIGPSDSNSLVRLFEELSGLDIESTPRKGAQGVLTSSNLTHPHMRAALPGPPEDFAVRRLASRAHDYLDYGLDDESRQKLFACERWAGAGSLILSREQVSYCLNDLDISDSDALWHETLARDYLPGPWLELLSATGVPAGLHRQIAQLATTVDWYLDDGLSAEHFAALASCIRESNITLIDNATAVTCLEGLGISDSDTRWYETMGSQYPGPTLSAQFTSLAIDPDSVAGQVLLELHDYLDNGLVPVVLEDLYGCFVSSATETAPERDRRVRNCRNAIQSIDDSDPDWFDTVTAGWVPDSLLFDGDEADTGNDVGSTDGSTESRPPQNVVTVDQLVREIQIFSPRATISDEQIRERMEDSNALTDRSFQTLRNHVIRTTNTDDRLLNLIFEELGDRGIDKDDRIALIFESDNRYGRALQGYLQCPGPEREQNREQSTLTQAVDAASMTRDCFENIDSFSYLRGIDGQIPGHTLRSDANTGPSENQSPSSLFELRGATRNLETPSGRQQLDYLRRLAKNVHNGGYQAIGVLGTDIFDKLLVLQAMRELNPDAVFFTTDIYSFLAHDSQLDWSRNLLVASSHSLNGLTAGENNRCRDTLPGKQLQDDELADAGTGNFNTGFAAPPFRDNYQSAYFHTTCIAVRPDLYGTTLEKTKVDQFFQGQGHLYEIGSDGPIDLQLNSAMLVEPAEFRLILQNRTMLELVVLLILLAPVLAIYWLSTQALNSPSNKIDGRARALFTCLYRSAAWLIVLLWLTCFYSSLTTLEMADLSLIGIDLAGLPEQTPEIFLFAAAGLSLLFLIGNIVSFAKSDWRDLPLEIFWINRPNALLICTLICKLTVLLIGLLLVAELLIAGGEPLALIEGVSSWPGTIIRIQVISLSFCFCLYAFARWDESNLETERALLGNNPEERRERFLSQTLGEFLDGRRDNANQRSGLAKLRTQKLADREAKKTDDWKISRWIRQIDEDTVDGKLYSDRLTDNGKRISAAMLWQKYRQLGDWPARAKRVLPLVLILSLAVFFTAKLLTPTPALYRESYWLADFLHGDIFLAIAIFVAVSMIMVGNDVTRLGSAFTRALRRYDLSDLHVRMDRLNLHDYRDSNINRKIYLLELIADRTRAITPLVLFPFLIVFLLIVARSSIFEGWTWDFELVLVYTGIALYILHGAFSLQKEARKSRLKVLKYLESTESKIACLSADGATQREKELYREAAVEHVNGLNKGAFVVWYRHPIFQSIAVPTSGTSGLFLLQYLS